MQYTQSLMSLCLYPYWYGDCIIGIIMVVDSCDYERFDEVRLELMKIAKNSDTQGVPLLIIANKQDLPGARSCAELEQSLSLHEMSSTHPWSIVPAIALIGEGLFEAMNTLYELMLKAKKAKAKSKSPGKK